MRGRVRNVVITLLVLVIAGVWVDFTLGLPLSLSTRSWSMWIVSVIGLGAFGLLGEVGAEWISNRDKVSDPLQRRVWHLAWLLAFLALITVGMLVVVRR